MRVLSIFRWAASLGDLLLTTFLWYISLLDGRSKRETIAQALTTLGLLYLSIYLFSIAMAAQTQGMANILMLIASVPVGCAIGLSMVRAETK